MWHIELWRHIGNILFVLVDSLSMFPVIVTMTNESDSKNQPGLIALLLRNNLIRLDRLHVYTYGSFERYFYSEMTIPKHLESDLLDGFGVVSIIRSATPSLRTPEYGPRLSLRSSSPGWPMHSTSVSPSCQSLSTCHRQQ